MFGTELPGSGKEGVQNNWKNGMEDIWYATVSNQFVFDLDAVMIRRGIAPLRETENQDWIESRNGSTGTCRPTSGMILPSFWSMPENTAHPAQKPEKLIAKLVWPVPAGRSDPGSLFGLRYNQRGCKLGRKYIGIEQNELYCIWAERGWRWLNRFIHSGLYLGVFWSTIPWRPEIKGLIKLHIIEFFKFEEDLTVTCKLKQHGTALLQ